MPDETDNTPEQETESKPTITIAEKQSGAAAGEAKPTITIAEKEGDGE